MNLRRMLLLIVLITGTLLAFAENNYKVTASTRLNVRKTPSANGAILGTFKSGQEIEVISISNGWAKVKYNTQSGYVRSRYIAPLPKKQEPKPEPKPMKEIVEKISTEKTVTTTTPKTEIPVAAEVETQLEFGSFLPDNMNLYLAGQGGFGWSNFLWNDGDVNGTMSFSLDIAAQLYFEKPLSFIPANWYSELAIGYDRRGAASLEMNYIHARIYPLGYRIPLYPASIVVKGGLSMGYPFEQLDGMWDTNFQVGIGGGIQIEWKQFAVGCNVEYDFTEVSSSCNQTLNNIAVLGTVSYKFAKFGHK